MTAPVITDREIQLARDRVVAGGDEAVGAMLNQLLDFREHGRAAVAQHDFSIYHNRGISLMTHFVHQSGCQWWQCTRSAATARVRRNTSREYVWLWCAHADDGEAQGLWQDDPANVRLKQEDAAARIWKAKWDAEAAAEAAAAKESAG